MGSASTPQACRIIIANGPRLFREMLGRAIQKHIPDMEVVGEADDPESLLSMVERTDAQWVILALAPHGKMPPVVEPLLIKYPSLRILTVATEGSQAHVKWLEFHDELLEGLSLDELIAVLYTRSPSKPAISFLYVQQRQRTDGANHTTGPHRRYLMRNGDILEGRWKQIQGKMKERWAALTDDDLETIQGSREVLVSLLQERYGYVKQRAEEEVDRFLGELNGSPEKSDQE